MKVEGWKGDEWKWSAMIGELGEIISHVAAWERLSVMRQ